MEDNKRTIHSGDTPLKDTERAVQGEYVTLLGEPFYRIRNFDALEPFFMTLVSSSDHWLFISSNGGLTAGRRDPDQALFPYQTEDKLTDASGQTGGRIILLATRAGRTSLWEPLSDRGHGLYFITRSLYKNTSGTALVFEEHNLDLRLTCRTAWRTSEHFGFVKTAWLINTGESACRVELLDGLQNILPANITEQTQKTFSNLLDAYKHSEVDPATGLGIFALNSRLTDKAEPGESLRATTVAPVGLGHADYLLSPTQLDRFRAGEGITPERSMRGRRGTYFAHAMLELPPRGERSWHLVADILQDSAAIARLARWLKSDPAAQTRELEHDIALGQASLRSMVASADGLQLTNDRASSEHHFANVMFNILRGGVFAGGYEVGTPDLIEFALARDRRILEEHPAFFKVLPARIHISELQARAQADGAADLVRMSYSYLPLTFSRRHGDPSRPWNRFSINIRKPDGSLKLDYEGNWRDIFQNWEALAYSYPEFTESMICTFLDATTADGYNPYRITHHGLDWEVPDPGNPWANIGYWSDHQVIYLQKLMEISARVHPGKLGQLLARRVFSYADVPYRIKPYPALLEDPNNTIEFDRGSHDAILERVGTRGTDARLVHAADGQVLHASLAEKLLTLLLAKLVNLVPEGGIWMNTQRPEWNDANNALVGKGLSVVTLCYLRRCLAFCRDLFNQSALESVPLHAEVRAFFARSAEILERFQPLLRGPFSDPQRREVMDALGAAGSDYRWGWYKNGFSGEVVDLPVREITAFLDRMQAYVEHSLRANKHPDHMFHAYNILHLEQGRARVSRLYEMLEGQVAMLSSGMLSARESLELLTALRNSALYQAEQHSYILYPDRDLPGFMQKNSLTREQAGHITLFEKLAEAGDATLVTRDVEGIFHFSGEIRNAGDVRNALEALKGDPRFGALAGADSEKILALFEETFQHDQFTGRSGTFFAYEGLGSIYWHMVSKLMLAAQETALQFREADLLERYRDIRAGLGFKKTPEAYGAFPADPYSHTPRGRGAKQPGMTGMVKETILARQAELGLSVQEGRLVFDGFLLDPRELLPSPSTFSWLDVNGQPQDLALEAGSLAYTFCQVPVVLVRADEPGICVHYTDGTQQVIPGNSLDAGNSGHIFMRDGAVKYLEVGLKL